MNMERVQLWDSLTGIGALKRPIGSDLLISITLF